jgi:YesN/AraC family two-component response regulator
MDSKSLMRLTVKDLTKIFSIDRSYLTRTFKEETELPMEEFLRKEKMLRVVHMLMAPEFEHLSIKSISEELGYCRSDYFIRQFKKCFLLTPRKFREYKKEMRRKKAKS